MGDSPYTHLLYGVALQDPVPDIVYDLVEAQNNATCAAVWEHGPDCGPVGIPDNAFFTLTFGGCASVEPFYVLGITASEQDGLYAMCWELNVENLARMTAQASAENWAERLRAYAAEIGAEIEQGPAWLVVSAYG